MEVIALKKSEATEDAIYTFAGNGKSNVERSEEDIFEVDIQKNGRKYKINVDDNGTLELTRMTKKQYK